MTTLYEKIPIKNYSQATNYDNDDFNPKGHQSSHYDIDVSGKVVGISDDKLHFYGLGYGDTQWNPSLSSAWWIEEIIDGMVYQHKYDGTNLTTYTDNVAGTPLAHTPENATYKKGKGVYPKVTADGYATYECTHFYVEINGYDSYDQSARYTILAGI